jgi:hypothetical protein
MIAEQEWEGAKGINRGDAEDAEALTPIARLAEFDSLVGSML